MCDIKEGILSCEVLRKAECLPEENEIIITDDGYILIDVHGEVKKLEIKGKQIGPEILCG